MSTSKVSTQSAAAKRAAEAEVRRLIDKFTPEQLRLIGAMRRSVRKWLPTAHEIVYEYRDCFVFSYSPTDAGYEGVLAIRGSGEDVRFYFNNGKELPDPEKLLHGTAKTRWIEVESAATLARPAVVKLIEAAIARNKVPFARTGGGSVVIRADAAKKRPKGRSG
jgi:hypothetical protein